jgi:molybdopterin synthase catalytic subunit
VAVRVQTEPFDLASELARMKRDRTDIGAIVTFTGVVRDTADGAGLLAMTLEHYPGMTEGELERVEQEARKRWPLSDCLIIHRYGRLVPSDDIVLVITTSAHRDAAFEAARFLMDYLKTSAPFWKKEERADGTVTWVDAKASDDAATARWDNG